MYKPQFSLRKAAASLLLAAAMVAGSVPAMPAYAEEDVPVWARDTGDQAGTIFEAQADLPAAFDLRQSFPENVTPVKCQSPFSTCWAFGGIAAAETSIAADFKTPVNLSERHLAWFAMHPVTDLDAPASQAGEGMYVFGDDPQTNPNATYIATNPTLATSLFSTGVGPVLEEDFPYRGKTGMTAYEYALTHKDDWKADVKTDLMQSFRTEKALLAAIKAQRPEIASVDEYLNTIWQETVDGLKNGTIANSYSAKDDWSIDAVDENGESNRNIFAGYTIRDGNLLPSPTSKDAQGSVTLNEAGMQAMKQELMNGRAISVSVFADTSSPNEKGEARYTNTNTWAAYVYEGRSMNHQVAIVGWDDNYATSNFNQGVDEKGLTKTPPAPGAWIVKNSWGRKGGTETKHSEEYGDQLLGNENWGVDGTGYFYISYYDSSLGSPETMTFGMDFAEKDFYTHAYDYLPAYDGFYVLESKDKNVLSSANVFTAASDEKVTSVSTRTDDLNTRVTFAIYLLSDDSKSPTDGTLVERFTRAYGYAGFHRVDLEKPIMLKEGERFSVVSTVTYVDKNGTTVYETVANKAMGKERAELLKGTLGERKQYGKAVLNSGESYIYEGGAWIDWTVRQGYDQFKQTVGGCEVDNFSIKAYAVPWDGASFPDVSDQTPHADEILWLANSEISRGYPDGTFRPTLDVTRQDMAAFLFRLAELWGDVDTNWQPTDEQKAAFPDVNEDTPHYREIMWLAASKISTGFPDKTFRPMLSVVRQDMAAFLFRLAQLNGRGGATNEWQPTAEQKDAFPDVTEETPHAREVMWLAANEVSLGFPDKTFRPMLPVVRQDMAAFLYRMNDLESV